ncbi:hypothetical protein ACJ41O_003200 [Fusarium nematophilum]
MASFPDGSSAAKAMEPRMLRLYANGDAILVIDHPTKQPTKCLISSTILTLASPYFDALFGSKFREAASVQQGECPEITLQEDDPEAMEIILSILHYKHDKDFYKLEPVLLASVAQHSDKYRCNGVLRPWASTWFSATEGESDPKELGLLLTAAYFFRCETYISSVSKSVIPHLSLDFESEWAKDEVIATLPSEIIDALATEISRLLDDMHMAIQDNERALRALTKVHVTGRNFCPECLRDLPPEAGQRRPCQVVGVAPLLCTAETRIAAYFSCLERHDL